MPTRCWSRRDRELWAAHFFDRAIQQLLDARLEKDDQVSWTSE